jgi:hypothetical protein
MNLSTTADYLGWLLTDNGAIELRHVSLLEGRIRWLSGWFDWPHPLLAEARARAKTGKLYTSLNARRLRHVSNDMTGVALCDSEVAFVTRMPFDFGPVRPTGVCATDLELAEACSRRDALVRYLHKRGSPLPLHAESGNSHAHSEGRDIGGAMALLWGDSDDFCTWEYGGRVSLHASPSGT